MAESNADARRGKSKYKQKNEETAEIDLAPMVDVAFLLLTFFMLTTGFSKPNVMKIGIPEDQQNKQKKGGGGGAKIQADLLVTVRIAPNSDCYMQRGTEVPKKVEKDQLAKLIKSIKDDNQAKTGNKTLVVLKISRDARYDDMINIIDDLTARGLASGLLTEPIQFAFAPYDEADDKAIAEAK
jgi:biopolymer transport protein ExbD